MNLNFDLGIKEYAVKGATGEVLVRFNPTDANFAQRAYETFAELEKKQKERANVVKETDGEKAFEFTKKLDKEMREAIDALFGCELCKDLFGGMNLYSLAGGSPVWANFMTAIFNEFDDGIKRERYLVSEKAKKYTNKYAK